MRIFGLVFVAAIAGCGGGSDDFDAPACAAGEVRVEGTVGGIDRAATATGATQFAFINALSGNEGTLTIGFATGDMLSLAWPDLVADGDSVEARGSVSILGNELGNCETAGFPGVMVLSSEGSEAGKFRLGDLREGADCAAAPLEGELVGCWQKQP